MKKKIMILGILFVMSFFLFSCTNNYVYQESDFSLVITVDKTEVRVGDTVKVTATLTNLSGKGISIQMPRSYIKKTNDLIMMGVFRETSDYFFCLDDVKGGYRKKIRLKKDTEIQNKMEFQIEELMGYEAAAEVYFYAESNYHKFIKIAAKPIKILVTE